ncbi:acetylglutamate kinase [Pseudobacillus badius]|uniref:acetylglutamate kinase n=1 Tax=Bacillus badius TaxID=1455 RepID=UPI0007B05A69|nr:acetylglutamate kinase [Bacillus badius]KZO01296.1 acetylglutamate kinase [Bacillus badius]OCS89534.1 acetylglutamate kinase [Bacillus badius]OVE49960.1 acetylglutamate kinase [Bacillus badius]TDW01107.1 N-acetylglutamate kinase [Bacillus badius]UAT31133.1 acetylglutamate kinase [Bacillus badius]
MKTIVVKCGGSVLGELSEAFFDSMKELKEQGYAIVFVHGGGPEINSMLEALQVKTEFKNGLRVTSEQVLQTAELALAGSLNRQLVRLLEKHGIPAIGLNSSDNRLLEADFIDQEQLGYVGDITAVNSRLIQLLCGEQLLPVMTPLAAGPDGTVLNINADHAACAVANALQADHFLMVTDVDGVLKNGKLVPTLTETETKALIDEGVISGGMIPKVHSALKAFSDHVQSVHIVSGKKAFYEQGQWLGTKFVKEKITV